MTPIMGAPAVTIRQVIAWLESRDAHPRLVDSVPDVFTMAVGLNVRPEVAIVLADHETDRGHYGGRVTPDQNNWGGIKTTNATGFASFATREDGWRAVLEHLHLYAFAPVPDPIDPRHFSWIAGTAPYVEDLSGRWSEGERYGQTLVRKLSAISEIGYQDRDLWPGWAVDAIERAIDEGWMLGDGVVWSPHGVVTRAELAVVLNRIMG